MTVTDPPLEEPGGLPAHSCDGEHSGGVALQSSDCVFEQREGRRSAPSQGSALGVWNPARSMFTPSEARSPLSVVPLGSGHLSGLLEYRRRRERCHELICGGGPAHRSEPAITQPGVFRFTYANGSQTSSPQLPTGNSVPDLLTDPYNDYVFFVEGQVYRGLVQANINVGSVAGVLDNSKCLSRPPFGWRTQSRCLYNPPPEIPQTQPVRTRKISRRSGSIGMNLPEWSLAIV